MHVHNLKLYLLLSFIGGEVSQNAVQVWLAEKSTIAQAGEKSRGFHEVTTYLYSWIYTSYLPFILQELYPSEC